MLQTTVLLKHLQILLLKNVILAFIVAKPVTELHLTIVFLVLVIIIYGRPIKLVPFAKPVVLLNSTIWQPIILLTVYNAHLLASIAQILLIVPHVSTDITYNQEPQDSVLPHVLLIIIHSILTILAFNAHQLALIVLMEVRVFNAVVVNLIIIY